jgi:hypothetical protein
MIFGTEEYTDLLYRVIKNGLRHDLYDETVDHAKEMSVHLLGEIPDDLLSRRRPREDEEVRQYRIDNYEPTTEAAADKVVDIFSKMFNHQLFSIVWSQEQEKKAGVKTLKEYTINYFPIYNSLINFNQEVVLRKMFADPNGLLGVRPERVSGNNKDRLKPILIVYGSPNIWYYDEDHYLIFLKEEKDRAIVWYYFEYYDGTWWRKFRAKLVGGDGIETEIISEYGHQFIDKDGAPEIPAWKLRGKSKPMDNGEIMYKSYISGAKPYWNLNIAHESDVQGAFVKHMNPQRYVIGEECNHKVEIDGMSYACNGGRIKTPDSPKGDPCGKCRGAGRVALNSPYEDYVINKEKLEADSNIPFPPIGYANVPVDATKMLEERADRMLIRGMWAINMDVEDKVGEVQSGVAKSIDRSGQKDTLFKVTSTMFDVHIQNEYYFINKYMNSVEDMSKGQNANGNLPTVNKPTDFDIQSVSELINNFDVSKKSGLDTNYLLLQQIEIASKDLGTNPDLKKKMTLLMDLDPFPLKTPEEVDLIASKYAKKSDAIVHFYLKAYFERALQEDPKFMDKTREEMLNKFTEYAQEVIQETKMTIDPNAIPPPESEV